MTSAGMFVLWLDYVGYILRDLLTTIIKHFLPSFFNKETISKHA